MSISLHNDNQQEMTYRTPTSTETGTSQNYVGMETSISILTHNIYFKSDFDCNFSFYYDTI